MNTDSYPTGPDTAAKLAAWLSAHMADTRQTAAEVAKELGVSAATVREWLGVAGRQAAGEINEFAHLDTTVKLGAWLRVRITDSGCSVRQIAETTDGVSIGTIYNWLKGEPLPPPPTGDEPDRFDLLLRNPYLDLGMRQRVQLDEIRRRLTGTSLQTTEPTADWPARGLPADNRSFTGRRREIKQLDRLLRDHTHRRAVVISALTGTGGVGKTALAIHWARTKHVKATFPNGCLYLNLNGYAESPPMPPDIAVTKLLYQLNIDPAAIPADPDARSTLYQEALAERRLLVILDNAHAEPQVRPLLPVNPDCLAIITSRNTLHGLDVTDTGITHLPLDTLTAPEAASLLRTLLGRLATRTTSDDDIEALSETCGHLPLALQIAAANYLTNHHPLRVTVSEYTATLADDRIHELSTGPADPSTTLTATMNRSYRHLSGETQRAYRLLGLHPGPDFTTPAAASLTGLTLARAQALLTELVQANLLTEHARGRYAFHDLIREHAADLVRNFDPEDQRHAASKQVLDHYLHTGFAAARLLDPGRDPITPAPAHDGVVPENLPDRSHAMSWYGSEHAVLLAAIYHAADVGFDIHAWQLTWTFTTFLNVRGHWHEQTATGRLALAAAQRLNDRNAQAHAHRFIAYASIPLGRLDAAHTHLRNAIELQRQVGDEAGQAAVHHGISYVWERKGRYTEALDHAQQALDLHRNRDNRHGQARALNAIGWLHTLLGHHTQALVDCRQALDLYRELDHNTGLAHASDSLGYAHHHLGHHAEAIASYKEALAVFQELHIYYEQAGTLTRLGDTHHAMGDVDTARGAWQEALDILTELDHADAAGVRTRLADLDPPPEKRG